MQSRYRDESAKQDRDSAECHERLHRCEHANAAEYTAIRLVVVAGKHHEGEFEFSTRSPAVMELLYEILNIRTFVPPVGGALDGHQDDAENQGNREDNDPGCCREISGYCDGNRSRRQKHGQYPAGETQQGTKPGVLLVAQHALLMQDQ